MSDGDDEGNKERLNVGTYELQAPKAAEFYVTHLHILNEVILCWIFLRVKHDRDLNLPSAVAGMPDKDYLRRKCLGVHGQPYHIVCP